MKPTVDIDFDITRPWTVLYIARNNPTLLLGRTCADRAEACTTIETLKADTALLVVAVMDPAGNIKERRGAGSEVRALVRDYLN